MINLREYMTQGSLFELIANIEPLPFLSDGKPATMDKLLILKFGDRTLYSKFATLPLADVAEMVAMLNVDNWKQLVALADTNKLASNSRTITETITNTENTINQRDDKNVVSAFNSDELITSDGMISDGTNNVNGETIRTMTDETVNLNSAYNNLSLSSKNNIIDKVIKDVADFITLNIY